MRARTSGNPRISRERRASVNRNFQAADEQNSLMWLSLDEACEYTGHSQAAIKRRVAAGKIEKKLVPLPGARPRVRLLREDLDRVFRSMSSPVEIGSVIATGAKPEKPEPTEPNAALIPAEKAVEALSPALEKLVAALTRPEIELREKLCWSLREARTMTGLSRPALRELVAAHPDLAIRRGRRVWFRAGKLRQVLG
jgi:hypothetical protein